MCPDRENVRETFLFLCRRAFVFELCCPDNTKYRSGSKVKSSVWRRRREDKAKSKAEYEYCKFCVAGLRYFSFENQLGNTNNRFGGDRRFAVLCVHHWLRAIIVKGNWKGPSHSTY